MVISSAELINNDYGFVAFQKKSEFGPAKIVAKNVDLLNVIEPYLIEKKSFCKVNDQIIEMDVDNVKNILYKN